MIHPASISVVIVYLYVVHDNRVLYKITQLIIGAVF